MFEVTLYGLPASVCIGCRASELSFRFKGIEVTKVRVDQDQEALDYIKGLGYSSAPVVVVRQDGEVIDHWGGFQEGKIEMLKELVAA